MDRPSGVASALLAVLIGVWALPPGVVAAQESSDDCDGVTGTADWAVELVGIAPGAGGAAGLDPLVLHLRLVNEAPGGMPWGTLPRGLVITADGGLHGAAGDAEPQAIELDADAMLLEDTLIPPAYPLPGRLLIDVPDGATPATLFLIPRICGGDRRAIVLPAAGAELVPVPSIDPILGSPARISIGPLDIEMVGADRGISCTSTGMPRRNPMAVGATIEFRVENRSDDALSLAATGEVVDSAGGRWPGFALAEGSALATPGATQLLVRGDISDVVDAGDCENVPGFARGAMWAHMTFAIRGGETPPTSAIFLLDLGG